MARRGTALRAQRKARRARKKIEGCNSKRAPGSKEVHVLAVDDSLVDRKVIERLLKISSCKVTAVDSGRRALQLLGMDEQSGHADSDGLKVDLIITDYYMPGMTGFELLKKIKESSSLREIPVVVMSSENTLARVDRCLEGGAEEFIVKPVKLSDVKRLRSYTNREVRNHCRRIHKRKHQEFHQEDPQPPTLPPSDPLIPASVAASS
ncbi:two-component response regulator ARR5-like [Punica granatum]|uniref:Two-component response regulator ARR5-like n=2 Tax=Punica granatum TaxID=22663 RepID=A0A6P8E5K1_PUNGR|nr:two-component response regulator ARR5-like [Punica granatum]PKI56201.1 hypothetical protein CRG98_023396 [Punica granatum]